MEIESVDTTLDAPAVVVEQGESCPLVVPTTETAEQEQECPEAEMPSVEEVVVDAASSGDLPPPTKVKKVRVRHKSAIELEAEKASALLPEDVSDGFFLGGDFHLEPSVTKEADELKSLVSMVTKMASTVSTAAAIGSSSTLSVSGPQVVPEPHHQKKEKGSLLSLLFKELGVDSRRKERALKNLAHLLKARSHHVEDMLITADEEPVDESLDPVTVSEVMAICHAIIHDEVPKMLVEMRLTEDEIALKEKVLQDDEEKRKMRRTLRQLAKKAERSESDAASSEDEQPVSSPRLSAVAAAAASAASVSKRKVSEPKAPKARKRIVKKAKSSPAVVTTTSSSGGDKSKTKKSTKTPTKGKKRQLSEVSASEQEEERVSRKARRVEDAGHTPKKRSKKQQQQEKKDDEWHASESSADEDVDVATVKKTTKKTSKQSEKKDEKEKEKIVKNKRKDSKKKKRSS